MSDHFQERYTIAIACFGNRLQTSVVIVEAHLEFFKQHPFLVLIGIVYAGLGAEGQKLRLQVCPLT